VCARSLLVEIRLEDEFRFILACAETYLCLFFAEPRLRLALSCEGIALSSGVLCHVAQSIEAIRVS
jgi:hypothetical protein